MHHHVSYRFQPRSFLLECRLWLPSLIVAVVCVLLFSIILISTALGRHVFSTLNFALGRQHIAHQQKHLLQALEGAFQTAELSVEMHRRGVAIPQRRGQEHWRHQIHTIEVPPTASLDLYESILHHTTHRLHHAILRRQKRLSTTATKVSLTVGIAGVPTDTFVFIQPRDTVSVPSMQGQLAIVIDDLGWDLEAAHALLTLEAPLSFAILPDTPYRMRIAWEAQRRGYDVLLHLPMEPRSYPDVDPGHFALLSAMRPSQLVDQIEAALHALPGVVGVNNHMGSRLTENRTVMQTVMQQIKHHHLFFLDSRTTKRSLAYQVAQEMGVPTARRQVFLDHEIDVIKIHQQLRYLSTLAYVHGSAIGIGHPYPQTVRALQDVLPEFRRDGIKIVPVSHLVR
jgi:polysaccharide deacetylase 2 family uncharacterized protein YibQ